MFNQCFSLFLPQILLNNKFLLMGRTNSFDNSVLRCTDSNSPSRLTFVPMINANGHKACGTFSSTIRITSPTAKFLVGVSHQDLLCSCVIYSRIHLLQYKSARY